MNINKKILLKFMNYWPPFIGAGIKIKSMSQDFNAIDVEMKLTRWNSNYVGTHFGGSLYAMADPFYMLIILNALGSEYIVWDKAAIIKFKKPGKGKVRAHFYVSQDKILELKKQAEEAEKINPIFNVEILDELNEVVAQVEKVLYIKKKNNLEDTKNLK